MREECETYLTCCATIDKAGKYLVGSCCQLGSAGGVPQVDILTAQLRHRLLGYQDGKFCSCAANVHWYHLG